MEEIKTLPFNIDLRIGEISLIKSASFGKSPYEYLEIVRWQTDKDTKKEYCYTIASWHKDKDDFVSLEFCMDRYKDVNWNDFKKLIDMGYKLYLEGE